MPRLPHRPSALVRLLLLAALPLPLALPAVLSAEEPAETEAIEDERPPDAESVIVLSEPPPLVTASLVADVAAVTPDSTLRVGVRYEMADGWHIYWENPGQSGLSTDATLTAPASFEAGPLQWPAPERHEVPGDIVNFGYEHEAVLLWEVATPDEFVLEALDEVRFTAETSWLACRETCVMGRATVELDLPVSIYGRPPALGEEQRAIMDRALAGLPRPLAEMGGAGLQRQRTGDGGRRMVLRIAEGEGLTWFPGSALAGLRPPTELRAPPEGSPHHPWELRIDLPADAPADPPLSGVLTIDQGPHAGAWQVELPTD